MKFRVMFTESIKQEIEARMQINLVNICNCELTWKY